MEGVCLVGTVGNSVAGMASIRTVMGTTGGSLLNKNNMSNTVRETTKPRLLTRYEVLGKYRAKRTGVAGTCGLPYSCIVRAMKPV